jgi:hypothetical protein
MVEIAKVDAMTPKEINKFIFYYIIFDLLLFLLFDYLIHYLK